MLKPAELHLTQEWDKTFPKSDHVDHKKVTFINRYGITLAADQYTPKGILGKLPAVAVCGPFGAVKEQCSGLYAQTLAERGFLTIAFDPSFTGESGGEPRYTASPDINTEDFGLSLRPGQRGPGAHRHPGHLWLGRSGPEHSGHRHPDQGHRGFHHVRHESDCRQGLL